jgi:hypothetical protein
MASNQYSAPENSEDTAKPLKHRGNRVSGGIGDILNPSVSSVSSAFQGFSQVNDSASC